MAQGVGGKTTIVELVEGGPNATRETKVNTFGEGGWKKFDWGLGIGVGVTFIGKIQVRAGYDHGLANVAKGIMVMESNGEMSKYKVKNRNAYLSVGFLFF